MIGHHRLHRGHDLLGHELGRGPLQAFRKWSPDAWPNELGPVSASGQNPSEDLRGTSAMDGHTIITEP